MDKPAQPTTPSPANPSAESTMAPPSGPLLPNSAPVAGSPPSQSTPGAKPKKKMSVGAIIGGALFLLLAGGAAAGFVFRDQITKIVSKPTPTPAPIAVSPSPTPDPTADWETYENNKYQYSIKIPNTWEINKENAVQNKDTRVFITSDDFAVENPEVNGPPKLSSGLQLQIFIGASGALNGPIGLKDYPERKEVIVDGQKGKLWYTSNEGTYPGQIGYFIEFPHKTLDFNMNLSFTSSKTQDELIDQILSTFKFTDSETVETSTWKTYVVGTQVTFKAPADYYVKTGGTTGKDVVIVADKQSSITPAGNYLTIDANGLSGYEEYSDYAALASKLERGTKASEKIQKSVDRILLTSPYIDNGKQLYGLTGYLKAGTAAIFVSFQSEDVSNPHMFDTIISTIKFQ